MCVLVNQSGLYPFPFESVLRLNMKAVRVTGASQSCLDKLCVRLLQLELFFFFPGLSDSATWSPLRCGGAVQSGVRVQDLADLQEGVSPAGRLHLDHGLRLGLHAAQRPDAAGAGARGPFDAQRCVFSQSSHWASECVFVDTRG